MVVIDKQFYLSDYYNQYECSLEGKTIHELIDLFNSECGKNIASYARFQFLKGLSRAFIESTFDCTSILNVDKNLIFEYQIKLDGKYIIPIIED